MKLKTFPRHWFKGFTVCHFLAYLQLSAALMACGTVANAQTIALLHTKQTILRLQAGRDAPRLVSLESRGIWSNSISEQLINSVEEDGRTLPLHWKLDALNSHANSSGVTFVYESSSPRLRLTWRWEARAASGPIEHSITVENLSVSEIWIPLQDSFRFRFLTGGGEPLRHGYIEKGAGKPSDVGTHDVAVPAGYAWTGRSSTYASNEDEREIIPWFMVQRSNHGQDGWYVGVEFSGRTRLTLGRDAGSVYGAAGLNPDPGPFRTRLLPHETFTTPTVFVGGFSGGADGLGNDLRPWIRQVLNNPETWKVPAYPPLVNSSWGSGMEINEALALRMLRDSAEPGPGTTRHRCRMVSRRRRLVSEREQVPPRVCSHHPRGSPARAEVRYLGELGASGCG